MEIMTCKRNVTGLLASAIGLVLICRISAVAVHRTLSRMCNADKSTDCSFQMPEAAVNSCLIHNTSVCKSMHFDASRPKQLLFESEAAFSVGLRPFIYTDERADNKLLSALNITLKTQHLGVTGFAVFMLQQYEDSICRVFDFSAARNASENINISLFYDCLTYLDKRGLSPYDLIVRSLPSNEELHYRLLIQKTRDIVHPDDWKNCKKNDTHVMMVNMGSLKMNVVEVKHASGTPSTNVTGRRIVLTSSTGYEKTANLVSSIGREMLVARFESVPEGNYNIVYIDNSSEKNCNYWKPLEFILVKTPGDDDKPQWVFISIVCGVAAGVILIVALLISLCYHLNKSSSHDELLDRVKALILYSYDCEQHFDVIQKWASYLKVHCKLDIVLDKEDRDYKSDPGEWISNAIEDNNVIILVISRGVDHKIKDHNVPEMAEGGPVRDQLNRAVCLLGNKIGEANTKTVTRVAMVVFDYTVTDRIPLKIKHYGSLFRLPGQMRQFLCYVHKKLPISFPIQVYPRMPGEDLEVSPKGKALIAAIKEMHAYQKRDPHWFEAKLPQKGEGLPCQSTDASKHPLLHCPNAVEIES